MTPQIAIEKVWTDDDVDEYKITTSDGCSGFCTKVYVGHGALDSLLAGLDRFKSQIYGGIYDVALGSFGPEYANGAFHARLHFARDGRGHLYITVNAESEWHQFNTMEVASRATLYLKSEPALLDRFIGELRGITTGVAGKVIFECV
jgi:hypothetical protein